MSASSLSAPRRPRAQPLRRGARPAPAPARVGRRRALARPSRPPLLMLHGWMDVAASFQFVVDALAERPPRARARLARLRRQRHAGRPTPTSSPNTSATSRSCSTRCSARARADRPARPQHGRQRRDALRGRAARARAPPRQPRRLRHAALEAVAGAGPLRQVARRAEDADAAAPLRRPRRRRRAPARRPTRCCAPTAPPGWPGTGRAPTGAGGAARPARRPEPQAHAARCSPTSTSGSSAGSGSPRRCSGSRATAPTLSIWWGDRYGKAEFHERLNLVASVERHVVAPAGHMLHHDRPEDIARLIEAFLSESRPSRSDASSETTMDVEHINAIGNRLADLTQAHRRPPGVSLTTTAKRFA